MNGDLMAGSVKVKKRSVKIRAARKTMFIITFIVAVLFVTFLILTINLRAKVKISTERAAVLENQIKEEQDRTQEIEDLENYMKSDDYIEQVAKEKLGMVKDGEIIFKAAD